MDDTLLIPGAPGGDSPVLPIKTAPAIAAENHLAAIDWPVTVAFCEAAITLAVADQTPADLNSFLRIAFRVDNQPAQLLVEPQLYQGLAALIDPEASADDLDGKIKALLLEAGLTSDLERLESVLGWRVALEQVHPAQDRRAVDLFWLDVALNDDKGGLLGLSLPPSHVERLAAHLAPDEPADPIEPAAQPLPVTLFLRTGSVVLSLADLKTVRPGDILLMDHSLHGDGRIGLVGGRDCWLFDAHLDDGGVTLISGRRSPHSRDRDLWFMDDLNRDQETDDSADASHRQPDRSSNKNQGEAADAPTLDELPIKLLFEIGRIEVALGELGELGPGHVFDLDRALHRSVDIRAAGKRIGQGEIVEVDGHIGVRIGRLFSHA